MEGGGNTERTCNTQGPVFEGCRLRIRMPSDNEWALGEVLEVRVTNGLKHYRIHYLDYTLWEDEWVMEDRMDMNEIKYPDNTSYPGTNSSAPALQGRTTMFPSSSDEVNPAPDAEGPERLSRLLQLQSLVLRRGLAAQGDAAPPRQQNIRMIELGKYRMRPLYYSPYPEMFEKIQCMYVCEFCLKPAKSRRRLSHHLVKCILRHPPGKEIYREEKISFFEVDGQTWKKYTHNLCLLGKLFLPRQTIGFHGIDPFVYYVLTHSDSHGCHIMGYFNRVKEPYAYHYKYTSAVTFPPYKDRGCGKLLADFTYKLFPLDERVGLLARESSLNITSNIYQSHWSETLLDHLVDIKQPRDGEVRPVITFKAAHKGQFLFSCGACGQSVCVASNVSHVGEWDNRQPFLCQYCGESFVRLTNWSTLRSINALITNFGLQDTQDLR